MQSTQTPSKATVQVVSFHCPHSITGKIPPIKHVAIILVIFLAGENQRFQ
jgi:hypothetical protein